MVCMDASTTSKIVDTLIDEHDADVLRWAEDVAKVGGKVKQNRIAHAPFRMLQCHHHHYSCTITHKRISEIYFAIRMMFLIVTVKTLVALAVPSIVSVKFPIFQM